jgi:hypothetical protein
VLRPLAPAVDIVLLPIEKVHFRPRAAPPPDLLAPDAPTDWIESPLTVTAMKVTYSRRDRGGAVANLLREEIELRLGASFSRYQWSYVVDINRERGCPDDWLCRKESVEVKALGPGGTSRPRETMFLPVSDRPLTWRDYIDQVLSPQGSDVITVKLLSAIDLAGSGKQDTVLEFVCTLDVRAARAEFLRAGGESAARILAATLHRQAARIELTRAERGRAMKISDRLMARSPRRRS